MVERRARPHASRGARSEPIGVGVGLVGTLFRLELDGRRRAGDDDRQARGADRRGPLRRDRPQHVRPRGRLLHRAVGAHDDRASRSATTPRTTPRPRTRVLLLEDVSTRGAIARPDRRASSVDDARPALRTLAQLHAAFWDDPTLAELPVPAAPRRRPVSGAVAFAYDTAWPDAQEFFADLIDDRGQGVRRRVTRPHPGAVREAVRRAARAVARRLAPRQPLPHARRRRDRGRLAAHRPFGRAARPLVLRDPERQRRPIPADYEQLFDTYLDGAATRTA